jgi:hypothetical protein
VPAFNPRKTVSLRPLGKVDVARLREDVLAIPEPIWDFENSGKPNDYRALDRTRHILFRFVDSTRDWRRSHDRPLWEAWRERLEPVLRQAVAPYGYANGVFPRVMLARMPPGGEIKPHQDTNVAARWPHKIHVPITTNDRVAFWIDGTAYHLPVGEAFEVNNMAVHAVRNDGDSDRIHLIFEYYDADQPDPDWMG